MSRQGVQDDGKLLSEIVDLLVAGGYFRARISTLAPFDKLIGGLAWSITASSVDLDLDQDLLFDEDASLGQKIRLGEAIEETLKRMGCPFPLQAHQIQGLDYPCLLPVFKWLLLKVFDAKDEFGGQLRRYSLHRFAQDFRAVADSGVCAPAQVTQGGGTTPANGTSAPAAPPATLWDALADRYRVRRLFRRVKGAPVLLDPRARVRATLLEYGYRAGSGDLYRPSASKGAGGASSDAGAVGAESRSAVDGVGVVLLRAEGGSAGNASANSQQAAAPPPLERAMEEPFDAEPAAPAFSLERWLEAGHIELGAADVSPTHQGDGGQELGEASVAALAAHQQQAALLAQRVGDLERQRGALREERDVRQTQLDQLAAALRQEQELAARIDAETAELRSKVAASPQLADAVARLARLVEEQQALEQDKLDFKAQCKQQRSALRQQISTWEECQQRGLSPEQAAQAREADEALVIAQRELSALQVLLASRNRAVALVRRRLDEMPTRAELVQYEKRFEDVGDQLESKLEEERKYFATFNMLSKVKEFLQKEISLLNSIHEQYEKVRVATPEAKQSFADSMKGVASGVRQSAAKVQQSTDEKLNDLTHATQQHVKLLQQQRLHYAMLKSFQEECQKGEQLRALSLAGRVAT